jgi:hypothetical protein
VSFHALSGCTLWSTDERFSKDVTCDDDNLCPGSSCLEVKQGLVATAKREIKANASRDPRIPG